MFHAFLTFRHICLLTWFANVSTVFRYSAGMKKTSDHLPLKSSYITCKTRVSLKVAWGLWNVSFFFFYFIYLFIYFIFFFIIPHKQMQSNQNYYFPVSIVLYVQRIPTSEYCLLRYPCFPTSHSTFFKVSLSF